MIDAFGLPVPELVSPHVQLSVQTAELQARQAGWPQLAQWVHTCMPVIVTITKHSDEAVRRFIRGTDGTLASADVLRVVLQGSDEAQRVMVEWGRLRQKRNKLVGGMVYCRLGPWL